MIAGLLADLAAVLAMAMVLWHRDLSPSEAEAEILLSSCIGV